MSGTKNITVQKRRIRFLRLFWLQATPQRQGRGKAGTELIYSKEGARIVGFFKLLLCPTYQRA
jgi:hypothetical protein